MEACTFLKESVRSRLQSNMNNPNTNLDYMESSFRKKMLEHIFISELMQEAWFKHHTTIEILKSELDSFGYDLVLEYNGVVRYVQLKSSKKNASTARQTVNINLASKPGGCVIWLQFEENINLNRAEISYKFFESNFYAKLSLDKFDIGKHTKGNADEIKPERPNTHVIPKGQFIEVDGIEELMNVLFNLDGDQK